MSCSGKRHRERPAVMDRCLLAKEELLLHNKQHPDGGKPIQPHLWQQENQGCSPHPCHQAGGSAGPGCAPVATFLRAASGRAGVQLHLRAGSWFAPSSCFQLCPAEATRAVIRLAANLCLRSSLRGSFWLCLCSILSA